MCIQMLIVEMSDGTGEITDRLGGGDSGPLYGRKLVFESEVSL